MIAAVKVRSSIDAPEEARKAMETLGLEKPNQVVFFEEDEAIIGNMEKAKDFITFGEASEEVIEEFEDRYSDVEHGTTVDARPPSGGYSDTKRGVNQGGSLGRRKSMDSLLERMS